MANWHWLKHDFTVWSEIQRDIGQFMASWSYQTRECTVCGYIQRRWL